MIVLGGLKSVTVNNAYAKMHNKKIKHKFVLRWTIYDDEDFSGPSYNLKPGKYPEPQSWGGKDDELSSVKPTK